jgi:hypothetical protein
MYIIIYIMYAHGFWKKNRIYRLHLESCLVSHRLLYSIPLEVAGLQENTPFGEAIPMSATSQFWYATYKLIASKVVSMLLRCFPLFVGHIHVNNIQIYLLFIYIHVYDWNTISIWYAYNYNSVLLLSYTTYHIHI